MSRKLFIGLAALTFVGATAWTAWACCGPFCQYPVINSVECDPDTLWPPNHKYREINVTADVNWVDADVDGTVTLTIVSDQPDDAEGEGDGHTTNDCFVSDTDPMMCLARAERAGGVEPGRTYTILVEARQAFPCDAYASYEIVEVFVPHDKGT